MNEEQTISLSKGVFVFKGNFKRTSRTHSKKITRKKQMISDSLWYHEFTYLWSILNEEFEKLTSDMFASMTTDLVDFVKTSHQHPVNEIPTAALLTGINMPDHEAQFRSLRKHLQDDVTPHIALLRSQDCVSLKYLIENMTNQFVNSVDHLEARCDEEEEQKSNLKKSHMTLPLLESWYENLPDQKLLVVILPDFESFCMKVLLSFILIVSSYLEKLPFVFVFGIATSITTLHTSFPYHVTSKINIRVFKCESSTIHLNQMLEGLFLKKFCPFQLGGKVFSLYTEIFLYYDFSVRNFAQNIKFAMMEHFCYGNAMSLCQIEKRDVLEILKHFTHEDCENVRQLMSFRRLVESESYENRIKLLTDDAYLIQIVFHKVVTIQKYIKRFYIFLKCLHIVTANLPGSPLGKHFREIYVLAVSKDIIRSKEYQEAFQLLSFQSRQELSEKLRKISNILKETINEKSKKTLLKDFFIQINQYIDMLVNINENEVVFEKEEDQINHDNPSLDNSISDRKTFKQFLLSRSTQEPKPQNKFEKLRSEILYYLMRHFEIYLFHYSTLNLHEIFFFDDISIKNKIIGIHRSAIHNALSDPQHYLQCECCKIPNPHAIKSTMPDICIAYKLHLECGKMINLYDWLLAFLCIVDAKSDDDFDDKSKKIVDPKLQARFTQAVMELEYLGFIKSSKRKADHVARLSWEG